MQDEIIRSQETATEASDTLTEEELESVAGGCHAPDEPVVDVVDDPNIVYVG